MTARIITIKNSGGARIAAEALSREQNKQLVFITNSKSFMMSCFLLLLQFLVRKVGEDYLFPVIFCNGNFIIEDNDELHWLLSGELNISRISNKDTQLYMHDLWWTTGFNCYPALKNEFEFAPKLFVSIRMHIRRKLEKLCNEKLNAACANATFISPTQYLKDQVSEDLKSRTVVNRTQYKVMKKPIAQPVTRKKQAIGFAPAGAWFRKGSDRTIDYIVKSAENSPNLLYTIVSDMKLKGLPKNVDIIRQTSHKNFLRILGNHHEIVFLTRNDNLPNVLIEAESLGLKVITTEHSGFKEYCKENVVFIEC